jgi:hypothetical protein
MISCTASPLLSAIYERTAKLTAPKGAAFKIVRVKGRRVRITNGAR